MKQMNRRSFIKSGAIGLAGITVLQKGLANVNMQLQQGTFVDKVKLGNSGLLVSRVAMGTGTNGYNKSSNQTRAGMESFVNLAHHAYERGIRFYDMAEGYGSMPFVGNSIKSFPRENLTLLTKMWTEEDGSDKLASVSEKIDQYRKEIGTDYIDILLMHCIQKGEWSKTRTHYMDGFSKAKQDGIVKAVGISCHNIDALREAAISPWVDVIMARINPFGTAMDDKPEVVQKVLATAKENGKGIIAMKVFGEGKHVMDDEREKSIKYVVNEGNVHSLTLGMETIGQMDDAIERVMKHVI